MQAALSSPSRSVPGMRSSVSRWPARLGLALDWFYSRISDDVPLRGILFKEADITASTTFANFAGSPEPTWLIAGLFGYKFTDWLDGRIGYRHLSTDCDGGGFVYDFEQYGFMLGMGLTW